MSLRTIYLILIVLGTVGLPQSQLFAQQGWDDTLLGDASYANLPGVRSALAHGANVNTRETNGFGVHRTPLMKASCSDQSNTARAVAVVDLLLDSGANIGAKDDQGYTALGNAIHCGNVETAKALLARGAHFDDVNADLFVAVYYNNVEMVKFLLERGADIEAKDKNSLTPLMNASQFGYTATVKVLLDHGANVDARDACGGTALVNAVSSQGNLDTVKVLLDHGANTHVPVCFFGTGKKEDALLEAAKNDAERQLILQYQSAAHAAPESTSRTALEQDVSKLKNHPDDIELRNEVIALALTLQPPPAIPDEARQHFMKAAAVLQLKNPPPSQEDVNNAAQQFRQALVLAPWWGDAYYNLARALEATGAYDDALRQLNFYLKTKPSNADAQEAQSRLYSIQAEKQSAAKAKEEHEQELPLRYVSGGAQRFRVSEAPTYWIGHGYSELYSYTVPEEYPYYANVFRMSNGHLVAVALAPVMDSCSSSLCPWLRDNIVLVDITSESCSATTMNRTFSETPTRSANMCGVHYTVTISPQPTAIVSVTDENQANITVPVSLLYRGRAIAAARKGYELQQGGWSTSKGKAQTVGLHFSQSVLDASQDPNVNPLSLVPQSFTVLGP